MPDPAATPDHPHEPAPGEAAADKVADATGADGEADVADLLRGVAYFADLPDETMTIVCRQATVTGVEPGETIMQEGSEARELFVVVEGELAVSKQGPTGTVELSRLGPGQVVGEMGLLDRAPRSATVTATVASRLVVVPQAAFARLVDDPSVLRRMFRTVTSRLRDTEDKLRHQERMAALGRMAAQLMHELNNPAAAVGRSAARLGHIHEQVGEVGTVLARGLHPDTDLTPPEPPGPLTPLERTDAEEAVATWLADQDVPEPWQLAPALAAAGWTTDRLAAGLDALDDHTRRHLARWLGLQTLSTQMVRELELGASRIAELVRVVKSYSYLDRGPEQHVVPTEGLRDTLVLLGHKLDDIEVVTELPDDLGTVLASGRELNQVWTNLVDNAADAMPDGGRLAVRARNEPGRVVVEVADTGSGIPPGARERIFDHFFTTKEPGHGTGLGLPMVHAIITRIGGTISVETGPAGTTFTVVLPTSDTGPPA